MSIGDDIAAVLPELRAQAESRMTSTFTPYAPSGAQVSGGKKRAAYRALTSTPGRITGGPASSRDTNTRTVTIGGVARPVVEGGLHIPISADIPAAGEYGVGWEYELTALGAECDGALLGSRWLVVGSPAKSQATARRLDVVRIA